MRCLRTVLGTTLAIVLAAWSLTADPKLGLASQPFRDLLKLTAMIGGPGFLMGGLALSHLVALLEHEGMGPWALRSAALVFGIALGAASFVSAVFLVAATGGCFGILLLPLFFPGPFVAGGVGLALGCQIGIAGRGGG